MSEGLCSAREKCGSAGTASSSLRFEEREKDGRRHMTSTDIGNSFQRTVGSDAYNRSVLKQVERLDKDIVQCTYEIV